MAETIDAEVTSIVPLTPRVVSIEMRRPDGGELPGFAAGSHVDLFLPNGAVRSYSLINQHGESDRYVIAVARDHASRGGSRYLHDELRTRDVLPVSSPRNTFPLDERAETSVLIAGGIGITPILSMVRRLDALGRDWRVHYCARTRSDAALLDELRTLCRGQSHHLQSHLDDETGRAQLGIATCVADAPDGAHFYCCGPPSMIDAFLSATAGLESSRVHVERFTNMTQAANSGGFEVHLARAGTTLRVESGNSILETLLSAGIDVPFSCGEGICGSCATTVIAGRPDHRDCVLSEEERNANQTMMICCSGSLGPRLILDS
jgi:tetrachlorobenzoquinone reductase